MDWDKFKNLLSEEHHFPCEYSFRFIMKKDLVVEAMYILNLEQSDVELRPSKKGNYIALHFKKIMATADQVIEVYQLMKKIDGVISL